MRGHSSIRHITHLQLSGLPGLLPAFLVTAAALLVAAPAQAAFPGANGKIVFAGTDAGNTDVYTIPASGGGETRLTTDPAVDSDPAWSPDGTKIVFVSNRAPHAGDFELYTMNADGSGQTRLANASSVGHDADPGWSADGTEIVFTSNRDGNFDLYKVNANGTGTATHLTETSPGSDTFPAWSPDGTKIAFQRTGSTISDICVLNLSTGPPANCFLNPPTGAHDQHPSWSPDGKRIAFETDQNGNQDIYAWNLATAGTGVEPDALRAAPGSDEWPAWSPDGQKIALQVLDVTNYQIAYITPTDSTANYLTTDDGSPFDKATPDWQPVNTNAYAKPVGASPLRVPLVPAFQICQASAANTSHRVPFDFPSCTAPQQTSSTATIGPNAIGFARWVVCPVGTVSSFCTPGGGVMPLPDIRVTGSIRDVKCINSSVPPGCVAGQDYNPNTAAGPYTDGGNGTAGASPPCFPSGGSSSACIAGSDLTETAAIPGTTSGGTGQFKGNGVQITDVRNGAPRSLAGTTVPRGFPVPMDCIPTASTATGSTCGVSTTVNALAPGAVVNGSGAVWRIGEIQVYDAGFNGTRGDNDDTLFAVQGLFAP
jgi:Tol biopolymer transport system component